MIYLDNASTTEVKQEVLAEMMPYFMDDFYNPSSVYSKSVKINKVIENARQTIAKSINARPNEIYFTSCGSESNCWVIQGFVNYWKSQNKIPVILTSVIEHKSIIECVKNCGAVYRLIPVDSKGFINLESLENYLQFLLTDNQCSILISVQYANNEIGTVQHIKKISTLCHKYNAVFHTDAVQAYGSIFCDVSVLDVDMLSVSGHKFGCPKGCGFLYIKHGIQIKPLIYGTQNNGMRGGTENVPYIVGMAVVAKGVNDKDYLRKIDYCSGLRDYAIHRLTDKFNVTLNGDKIHRLPNNINVTFHYPITAESLIHMLDMSDIYISAGSACNSHITEPSYVLKSIGLTHEESEKTIRLTINENITKEDIDFVINEIEKSIKIMTMP